MEVQLVNVELVSVCFPGATFCARPQGTRMRVHDQRGLYQKRVDA